MPSIEYYFPPCTSSNQIHRWDPGAQACYFCGLSREEIKYRQAVRYAEEGVRPSKKAKKRRKKAAQRRVEAELGVVAKPSKRELVKKKDGYRCHYCKAAEAPNNLLTIDHVMPSSRGGSDDALNLVAACRRCNNEKADRTPQEWVDRWYLREEKERIQSEAKRRKSKLMPSTIEGAAKLRGQA